MNEVDINYCLLLDDVNKNIYNGVLSRDEIKYIDKSKESLHVVNSDPSYLPGTHWFVIYINNQYCEIFDSLGKDPKQYGYDLKLFMNKYDKTVYSKKQVQASESNICSIFCIYFCFYRLRGYSFEQIIATFSNDQNNNESMMNTFFIWYLDNYDR